jgi:enoyl-CoA hydratase/carnithine racemase
VVGVVGEGAAPAPETLAAALDLVVADEAAASTVATAVAANPTASAALALLLRGGDLVAESATYSALQAGPEHQAWLAGRQARRPRTVETSAAVFVERTLGRLSITLDRPHVHNAFSARMRDELTAALLLAVVDPTIEKIVLAGAGPSFCSGGDLDEFGTVDDPASAHVLRTGRHAGRLLEALAARVVAHVHGACVGAGVELPSFAARVVAEPDASFRLPEVTMGLVPGAGGTVSIPRRIGRQRTAWMALTGAAVDAPTALAWGLVDEMSDSRETRE